LGVFLLYQTGIIGGGNKSEWDILFFTPISDFLVISDGYDGGEKKSPGDASAPSKKSRSGISWMG